MLVGDTEVSLIISALFLCSSQVQLYLFKITKLESNDRHLVIIFHFLMLRTEEQAMLISEIIRIVGWLAIALAQVFPLFLLSFPYLIQQSKPRIHLWVASIIYMTSYFHKCLRPERLSISKVTCMAIPS